MLTDDFRERERERVALILQMYISPVHHPLHLCTQQYDQVDCHLLYETSQGHL